MGKVLDGFDFTSNRAGRGPSYDWPTIFDGQARMLIQGSKDQVKAGDADFDYGRNADEPSTERATSFVSGMRTALAKAIESGQVPENKQLKTAIVDENGGTTGERVHVVAQVVDREAPKRGRKSKKETANAS